MMNSLPSTMHAVMLWDYDGKPQSAAVEQVPLPRPGAGQVLIQIAASPVNPSDIMFLRGFYGFKKPLPSIAGFEGSGTVVAAGSGLLPRLLAGRRVACAAADPDIAGGTWSQYLVTRANRCIPLSKEVTTEQGATMLINPMTAWGLLEQARQGGHRAVVQTAAAGAVGRMVVRLARRFSVTTINIVRRSEQEDILRKLGAEHILNENAPDFDAALENLCHKLYADLGFDAVAGDMSGRILRAQPKGSRLLVYGALSMKSPQIEPASLIFEDKRVDGFWLTRWLQTKNTLSLLAVAGKVQRLLGTDLSTDIQTRLPLQEFARGIQEYKHHMTRGKVLLVP